MKEGLLSGLSTHGYKSLNKAAGGITEYDYKARRKKRLKFTILLCNLLQTNKSIY